MRNGIVLIPSYEPDELLINTVNELIEAGFPILVVNDGSGPEYDRIFDQVKDKVKYLSYEENHGKGYAMKHGYRHIKEFFPHAKYIITADGDGQHSTEDIIKVSEELDQYDELVFGVRDLGKDIPAKSKAGNTFSKATRSLLTKTYIQDDQCGLRGFPIRYLPDLIKLRGNRYEYEMNQITYFQIKQYPMITIPIKTIYLDGNSRSHFRPFKDTMKIQFAIWKNAIISFLTLGLYIFGMIYLTRNNVFDLKPLVYNGNSFNFIPTTAVVISSLGSFSFYYILMSIFYPTKKPLRRLWKELLFSAIRTYALLQGVWLFIDLFGMWCEVIYPIFAIGCCAFNIFFAWAFRKLFKTF